MMKSLYSGVAGMKTHNQRMDVIGNNISNVNTTGYKTSEVTFKDVYYQTKANASSGDATSGGKNPTQIGYGSQLGTVSQVITQSGFTYTDSVFNCALQGDGFFQVMDGSGNIFYTRAGKFSVDSYGNLCDPNGNVVLGVSGDPTGVETGQSQRINLKVPAVENNNASATKTVNGFNVTITADTYGEDGNISFTIVDSDTPYATKTGTNMTIYMDLSQDFGAAAYAELKPKIDAGTATEADYNAYISAAMQEFKDALNNAIKQGGTDINGDVLDLNIEFETNPSFEDIRALSAKNTVTLNYGEIDASGNGTKVSMPITFEAVNAGDQANKYEIDLKSSTSADSVTAKWKDNVLVITVPADGVPRKDDGTEYATLEEAINDAINNGDRPIKATVGDITTTTYAAGVPTETTAAEGSGSRYDFSQAIKAGQTQRLGLGGTDTGDPATAVRGRNNFFSDMATALSTVTLTGGRTAKEQAVDDLDVIQIDSDGTIYGRHAVHGLLLLGRIDIATFENPTGLEQCGTSLWRASLASGEAQVKIGGKDGAGEVVQGALEMSNVDLAQEFSDMIITQRGYQANSRVITVSDTMLEELVNLKR